MNDATITPEPTKAQSGPTGPRTEVGKARTRLNAFRHGLTSREFVFSPQDAGRYAQHSASLHQHFQPLGPIEISLVNSIASGAWRLDRAAAIEDGIFALALDPESDDADALAPARAWLADGRSLGLLTTYEQRIRRALTADKAELKTLQAERSKVQESCEASSPQPPAPESQPLVRTPESVCSTPPTPPPTRPNSSADIVVLVKSPAKSPAKPPHRDAA